MSGQRCGWPGCQVNGRRKFCGTHWSQLPRQIRQQLTSVPSGDTPAEVLAWIRRAIAETREAAERAAEAQAAQETLW